MHPDSPTGTPGPIEHRTVRHPLGVRHLTVTATRPVTAAITRVTLTGPELAGFTAEGPADHVKLLLPDPETGVVHTPFAADGTRRTPDGPVIARDYTPLAHRPAAEGRPAELDLDLVLHGDDGPASAWAARAAVGDRLAVAGPRGSHLVPGGLGRLVLVVDETAYPAAARWLRLTDPDLPVTLLLTTADPASAGYFDGLTDRPDLVLETTVDPEPALRALGAVGPDTLVFLAGEAGTLIPLRRYLRRELGLPAAQVDASGYWKRDVVALDHHAPLDPSDPDD
ncbi:MAG TPA: siderophore-interacting protein [Cellulomonas sp.]